jgi:hypothetical protein
MYLKVLIGAIAKELRAAGPEVGEPGDVLLGREEGALVKMEGGHGFSPLVQMFVGSILLVIAWLETIAVNACADSRLKPA